VFEFDDLCSATDCLLATASESGTESVSPLVALELKLLPNSLQYSFLWPDESLLVIIAFDLDQDQKDKLNTLLIGNKEAIGWTFRNIKSISPSIV